MMPDFDRVLQYVHLDDACFVSVFSIKVFADFLDRDLSSMLYAPFPLMFLRLSFRATLRPSAH